jgi:hypothetical protein
MIRRIAAKEARLVCATIGCIIFALPLAAQQASGKITGVVTDASGAVIPGVIVVATNTETGDVRRAETNASGTYVVSPLPVGDYKLEARKEGFKALTRESVRIDVNAAPTLDLELGVGNVDERVNVTAEAPTISTENQAIGNSRYEVQLKNLPTNVREVQALVGQTAGVPFGTTDTVGGNFAQGGRSAMQVVSDGAQLNPFQTTAWPAIDGIGRRADLTVPSTEAIAEVRWVSNGGSAEYAQPTQVIIASKSGSNELHGAAWEDYRSGGLGARRWEAAQRESFVRHQYGGTIGGPIKKDKMFFFGGVDIFSHTLGALLNARQPTAAERAGDLSGLLQRTDASGRPAPVTIFDPLTGVPFPGNVIPQIRLSPVATELLKLIPTAPTPGGNISAFNAVIFKPEYDKSQKFDARWDENLSAKDRLFARSTIGRLDQASRFSGSVPGGYGYSTKKEWTHAASANWTRIVDPNTVAIFQFTFRNEPFKNIPSGGDTSFGVPIVNLNPKPPFAGPPAILINSNGLGISDLFDRLLFNYSADYGYAFDPSITKTIANHTIKAGFTFLRGYKTQELASPPYGRFQTVSDYNNAKSTTSATGDAFADFLLGYPSSTDVTVGPAGAFVSKTNYAAYIQDDWKITPKLTLNFGLRYDRFGFFEEMNKRSAKGDFALGKIVIQQGSDANIQQAFQQYSNLFVPSDQAGLPGTFVHPNNRDFTPRIGFAYRVTPTFVIRSGFGIYAVDVTHNSFTDQYNQPPFIYRAQLSRSLLISQSVNVNSLFTFQNPTANGSTANATAALAAIGGFSDTYPTMKAYTGNVTVEKDFGHGTSVRATFATNEGQNLSRVVQVNACVPGPVQCLSRAANDPTGRKWPFFNTNFGQNTANGTSNFQSGEIEFIKRFSGGLLFDVNYAHSRLLALTATATNPVAAPTWSYDYGPNSAEPNDIFHWNFVWEAPVGRGHRFGSHMNRLAEGVLGGWLLSGLGTWQTGVPLTVAANSGITPSGATANRADRINSGGLDTPTPQQWFAVTAYKLPPYIDASQARPVRQFGTTGVGTVYGPRLFSFDMTMQKSYNIGEHLKLRLRAQAYNIFNHPILGNPDLEVTSTTFGQIRASQTTGTGAAGYVPRSLQLGARFEF